MKIRILLFSLLIAGVSFGQQLQQPAWISQHNITGSDHVFDNWVDEEGNSYSLGRIGFYEGHLDGMILLKLNDAGEEVWSRVFLAFSGDWQLFPAAVTGDDAGNIYILYNEKYRYTESNRNRIAIQKLTSAGETTWSEYLTESVENLVEQTNPGEFIYKNGHLYLAGSCYDNQLAEEQGMNGLLYKVSSADGEIIYRTTYNSEFGSDDMFKALAANEAGEVWTVGRSRGFAGPGGAYSDWDAIVVKWSSSGDEQWTRRLNGTGNSEDFGINLSIDDDGNCYTSNQLKLLGISQKQVVIEKLSSEGEPVWDYGYMGSSSGYVRKQPLSVLPNGNVVCVFSNQDGINTISLSGDDGSLQWHQTYSRDNLGASDNQSDLVTDEAGNIYITGTTRDNTPYGNGMDLTTLKYSAAGDLLWHSYLNVGDYDTAGDHGVTLFWNSATDGLYVVGNVQDASYNNQIMVVKFGEASVGIADEEEETSQLKLFPNPANDFLNFAVHHSFGSGRLQILDMNGRVVKSISFESSNPGSTNKIQVSDLAPGVYFLELNSANLQTTERFIKE